jgi:dTMP kinase
MKEGYFFAFEGIDGAGKSSIIKALAEKMDGLKEQCHITAEPTKNHIGKTIRDILLGKTEGHEQVIASLFLADRLDHLLHSDYGMIHFLKEGKHVLCDRYYLSSYAYHVPHVSLEWVIEANSVCAAHRRPDVTFFIDITVEESIRRLTATREVLDKYENVQRISQVHKNYQKAIEAVNDDENIVLINGMQPLHDVIEDVWQIMSSLFRQ